MIPPAAAPTTLPLPLPATVDAVIDLLAAQNYICDRRLATAFTSERCSV